MLLFARNNIRMHELQSGKNGLEFLRLVLNNTAQLRTVGRDALIPPMNQVCRQRMSTTVNCSPSTRKRTSMPAKGKP